jgi:hypothetical protein
MVCLEDVTIPLLKVKLQTNYLSYKKSLTFTVCLQESLPILY